MSREKKGGNMKYKNIIGIYSPATLVIAATLILMSAGTAMAAVWTDQADYSPGSIVTISGDNSDNAGYFAGETVIVSVNGPYNYDSKCSAIADSNGAWSCTVTLVSDLSAEGTYYYTAVGQNVSQSGMFTDSVNSVTITSPTSANPQIITSLPATATISFTYTTSTAGTTTVEAQILGTGISNLKTLISGAGLSDSIQVTIPAGTANGNYNAKVTLINTYGTGANNGNDVQSSAVRINVPADNTPPVITPIVSGTIGNNGWYINDVTVSWTVTDAESEVSSKTGCDSTTINADTAGTTLTCVATSAGGTNSQSVTIKRDATPPTISGSASPAPNPAGWNKEDVTVTFTCSDALSDIDSCTASQTLSTEGAGQSSTGTAVDKAGNTASATVSGINIDKTVPTVTITGITNGATYTLGSVPEAGCDTTDALSGVAISSILSLSGTWTVTATCSGATDNAGNTNSAIAVYYVVYNWNGFFHPVDNLDSNGNLILNVVKAGSAIPAKFSLNGNQGIGIFATGYPKSQQITCNTNALQETIEETATSGSSSLQYDPLTDTYIYVWKTDKSWSTTCRQLQVKLIDGTTHVASFKFSK
jgi:hypothetical protein